MGRRPCCEKSKVKRGTWSPEEDEILKNYLQIHGTANWISLPHKAGLRRCGKSCRLRWLNYLRPNIKLGGFTEDEEFIICNLFSTIGSRWSAIASHLPGRTDNDVKNYWHTKLKKKLMPTKSDVATAAAASDMAAATATSRVAPPENDMNFPFCPPQFDQDASPFWSFCNEVSMDEFSWEILSGILPRDQEEVVGADVDADLFSIFNFDSKPRGVSPHH